MLLPLMLVLGVSQQHDASIVEELQRFEQRPASTWQAGDCSAWGAMLHAEWSVIHMTGETITKDQASGDAAVSSSFRKAGCGRLIGSRKS